jgi:hypothetical protein
VAPGNEVPGFAPDDPTDGRQKGDWKTKYPDDEAQAHIVLEAKVLGAIFFGCAVTTFLLFTGHLGTLLRVPASMDADFVRYGAACAGGLLGGTLISIKWLYHSVARQIWNIDRRLWRFFTPLVSAGLAFGLVALLSSGIITLFSSAPLSAPVTCLGMGFIIGLFSDSAIAKLKEVADTLFGSTEKHL